MFRVYGYVIMPDHVHLLVSEPIRGTLAQAIQSFKISSSLRTATAREFEGLRGPLWQKRYFDYNVKTNEEFEDRLRYLHRNPVRAGLCEKPEDWLWSSFRHYALHEQTAVTIESEWTARRSLNKESPT